MKAIVVKFSSDGSLIGGDAEYLINEIGPGIGVVMDLDDFTEFLNCVGWGRCIDCGELIDEEECEKNEHENAGGSIRWRLCNNCAGVKGDDK